MSIVRGLEPMDRMARFEVFIGVWNTSGEVLATDAAPAGTLVATDTCRWLPGRQFIVHDVDARFDGMPTRSMEAMTTWSEQDAVQHPGIP